MALIFCPECLKEVSDKSETCIHCGYPLNTPLDKEPNIENRNVCPKCGYIMSGILNCTDCGTKMINTHFPWDFYPKYPTIRETWDKNRAWKKYIREKYVINSEEFDEKLYNKRLEEEAAYNKSMDEGVSDDDLLKPSAPTCPTCQSTNVQKISVGSKAVGGFFFGLFSSDVRNTMKCNNCGYKW